MDHNTAQLRYIPLDELRDVWQYAKRFILPAAYHAKELTEEDIIWRLADCRFHLFTVENNGMIGALTVQVAGPIATVVHLGGEWEKMAPFEPELSAWCKAQGAEVLRIRGRRGWLKKLPEHGFREKMVTMEKSL